MGRNMFGPRTRRMAGRGLEGLVGADPAPTTSPVFVLTHHPRPPLEMDGGTTFHFVSGDIADVLAQAVAAADGKDVRIGGGVATVRAFLEGQPYRRDGTWPSRPSCWDRASRFFTGWTCPPWGYAVVEHVATTGALHVIVRKR